jgi:hypothetical protein
MKLRPRLAAGSARPRTGAQRLFQGLSKTLQVVDSRMPSSAAGRAAAYVRYIHQNATAVGALPASSR